MNDSTTTEAKNYGISVKPKTPSQVADDKKTAKSKKYFGGKKRYVFHARNEDPDHECYILLIKPGGVEKNTEIENEGIGLRLDMSIDIGKRVTTHYDRTTDEILRYYISPNSTKEIFVSCTEELKVQLLIPMGQSSDEYIIPETVEVNVKNFDIVLRGIGDFKQRSSAFQKYREKRGDDDSITYKPIKKWELLLSSSPPKIMMMTRKNPVEAGIALFLTSFVLKMFWPHKQDKGNWLVDFLRPVFQLYSKTVIINA
jgi:hypothetical protein